MLFLMRRIWRKAHNTLIDYEVELHHLVIDARDEVREPYWDDVLRSYSCRCALERGILNTFAARSVYGDDMVKKALSEISQARNG